jgi:hypothetical protein
MPANLTEFADDTAFERYLLDRATPLLPRSQGTSVIELGEAGSVGVAVGAQPAAVHVSAGDSTGFPGASWALTTSAPYCSALRGRCLICCAS